MTATGSQFYGQGAEPEPRNSLGMLKVKDPSSGQTLYCRHGQKFVKSPVTGAKLRIANKNARENADLILTRESQSLQRSKNFYITEEYDILIQSLRNTNHFNENTNEKRGLDNRALGTIGAIPEFMTRGISSIPTKTKTTTTTR